jgi:hypothetical protein
MPTKLNIGLTQRAADAGDPDDHEAEHQASWVIDHLKGTGRPSEGGPAG